MSDGRFVLPAPESVTMTGEAARRLIGCGSGDAALVYIYILHAGGRFDPEDAALRTGRTLAQIEAAMGVLTSLGLVTGEAASPAPLKPKEPPRYTSEDISREMERGEAFKALVNEVQSALGGLLSPEDLIRLFSIYDYNGLPPEVILMLVTYCKEEMRRRYGPGRVPTMKYIEKTAFSWEAEGIFSLEAAEAYLRRISERRGAYSDFTAALGIKDRQLTATERKYVDGWLELGFGPEAAAIACDRTVVKTGRLTWRYMDSIMKSWHSKGLHSPEEIEKGDSFGPARPNGGKKPGEASAGGATEEELLRLRRARSRLKGGQA